jgi:hypothetical protein
MRKVTNALIPPDRDILEKLTAAQLGRISHLE